ncbi:Molybdopterin or thiamine biosynthesis adenylyltransferase [Devosia crocina]|uniref:Molybdopterin or thiamine biosynthesis adenylyltransferase n=1 Tax=Devosia crocina TaxID=429728 RepID=A0A1I7NTM6_9HYPH|nr:molybdopterin-synthase adenylyltransferase MoeB [Devosia crocina]SFV37993.1 Molybdopterin or thiamine biosynthesis adenylyltransferase [Devosia crocina]
MAAAPPLTPDETRRYGRHLVLKGFGGAAQQKLRASRMLVIGAGGLGSPAIAYLAAAGVGHLGIVDPDTVSLSNLQRQIVHNTAGIAENKAESAAAFAHSLNPHVTLEAHTTALTAENATSLFSAVDLVLDGSDNLLTRRTVAATAEAASIPLVSGAVSMFSGQVTVFAPHLGGPRHDALFSPDADDASLPSCELNGILGPVTGVIGTLMAMEAIKLVTGVGTPLIGRVLLYDGRDARFEEITY